jgi:hypothetical protein
MQVICHSHSARESGIYAWKCGEYMRNIGGHLRNAIEKRDGMRSCLIAHVLRKILAGSQGASLSQRVFVMKPSQNVFGPDATIWR